HPFSMVENEEFKKFVKLLCPNYNIPNRKTLSNSLLSAMHKEILNKITNQLANSQAICLTCDGWTNINNTSFYALTAHYIDSNTQLKSHLLECSKFNYKHTGLNISQWIDKIFKKFHIENKISAVVTDNAANIKFAINNLKLRHISCFAHSLNLVVQNAINKNIKDLVEKTKIVVQYFKQSSFTLTKLHEMQNNMSKENLKLKQDVPTRWNSTFEMLHRFLINKEPIISALALLGYKNTLQPEEWDLMEHCVNLLRIFNEITSEISSEKNVSLSKTTILSRIMIRKVKTYLEDKMLPVTVQNLGEGLVEGLSNRFGGRETNDLIAQSIFLDPRFKKQGFGDENKFHVTYQSLIARIRTFIIQESISQTTQPILATSSTNSIWKEFDTTISKLQGTYNPSTAAIVEIDKYLAELHIPRTDDPLIWWESKKFLYPNLYKIIIWWESRKFLYPNLYKITLKRLCIPATSVLCERIFSKAGQICNEKRSRLTTKKINQILIVNSNI
ncbi:Putative AC transposase, partial [Harpegnathos saltator]